MRHKVCRRTQSRTKARMERAPLAIRGLPWSCWRPVASAFQRHAEMCCHSASKACASNECKACTFSRISPLHLEVDGISASVLCLLLGLDTLQLRIHVASRRLFVGVPLALLELLVSSYLAQQHCIEPGRKLLMLLHPFKARSCAVCHSVHSQYNSSVRRKVLGFMKAPRTKALRRYTCRS